MSTTKHHWLKPHHLILAIGINAVWGLNLVTSKLGVHEIPPVLFVALRAILLALFCAPWLRWFPGQMRNIFGVAMGTGAGGFGFLVLGLSVAKDVSTVAIFSQLIVPFATLFSVIFLGEVIHWRRITGITLAFLGVFIIGFDPRAFSYLAGLLCVVLHATSAASGMIFIKRLHGVSPMQLQAWIGLFTMPVMIALSLLLETNQVPAIQHASLTAWGAVAFAVLGSSLAAQTVLFYLLRHYPVSSVAPLNVLSTLFGALFGVLINHDVLTSRMIAGGIVTLAGVLIIELRTKKMFIAANDKSQ
ncbi:MAG: DMT family transporter [Steroidobacter sp.]